MNDDDQIRALNMKGGKYRIQFRTGGLSAKLPQRTTSDIIISHEGNLYGVARVDDWYGRAASWIPYLAAKK